MARTVLSGATLVDGLGGPPQRDVDVVIDGERIVAIERHGTTDHADATVVDCRGRFVLPGFIDVHIHYFEWMGEMFLVNGVTTVKDVGNDVEWVATANREIEQGLAAGPRIFYTGNGLDTPPPRRDHFIGIESDDMARAVVRLLHLHGAMAIKVREMMRAEQLPAIVAAAHELDLKVTGHLRSMDARQALDAGIDGLEHVSGVVQATMDPSHSLDLDRLEKTDIYAKYVAERMSYSLIDEDRAKILAEDLAADDVALIPTMSGWWRMATSRRDAFAAEDAEYAHDPQLAYVPEDALAIWRTSQLYHIDHPDHLRRLKDGYRKIQQLIMQHRTAGGRLLAGSDTYLSVPGINLLREMVMFVDMGLTPLEAIAAATIENARFMSVDADLGSVEPGKLADLVVLAADPVASIENVMSIVDVYKGGQRVDRTYHSDYALPTPRPVMVRPLWIERQLLAEGYEFQHPAFTVHADDSCC